MKILLSLTILFWFIVFVDGFFGMKKIKPLEQHKVSKNNTLISVIVAAKNEEKQIEKSLLSQFKQTYKHVEWFVVNDRSTDGTRKILSKLEKLEPRLRVIHIKELPSGWLGKNHALYQGFQKAEGKYILFTDADIIYEKHAFERAISYVTQKNIDHLSLVPYIKAEGFWHKAFIAFFLFGFSYFKRPWIANKERSKQGIGIGAFNMITREAYISIGTHASLSLSPDDDLQLGMKVKQAGFKQRLVTALTLVEVEWYESLSDAIRGLEKNAFAGLYYRLSMVFLAIIGIFLTQFLPFILLIIGEPVIRLYSFVAIMFVFAFYLLVIKKMTKFKSIYFLVFPLTALIFIYTIIRATYLTYRQGGMFWRGTFYTLSELKKGTKKSK